MKRQHGFSLIEVLVGMTLLSMATIGMVKLFGAQSNIQSNASISLKSLQDQRYLERAIWAKYDNHTNAVAACDITVNSSISLDANNTCVSGTGGSVWAEGKAISDSGCAYASFSTPTLNISGCTGTLSSYASNINSLTNKSELKVTIWASNVDAVTCVIANTPSPANVSGANLQLTMASDCVVNMSAATNAATRLPKWSIKMLRKGGGNDGYQRFYY